MCGFLVWERDPATSEWAEAIVHWRKQVSGRKEAGEGSWAEKGAEWGPERCDE